MRFGYNIHTDGLDILKVDDLPFPVLLGHDGPTFSSLVSAALLEVAATEEEQQPGSSIECGEAPPLSPDPWEEDADFQQVQNVCCHSLYWESLKSL